MLLVGFTLVTNNKIHYGYLALVEALLIAGGLFLWTVGFDLWRGSRIAGKIGSIVLLLLAVGCTLCWLGMNYFLFEMLVD